MNIEIRDPELAARIEKQLQASGSHSLEAVLRRLLENRDSINAKIKNGIQQLNRGEGIPEDQLDSYLARLKAKHE